MKIQNQIKVLLLISILFALSISVVSSSTLAIDFGTEFITSSIIESRKPISLVENLMSKTKTNQYLSIENHERTMGYDAIPKINKNPQLVFHSMQEFIGKLPTSPELQNYLTTYFQDFEISMNKITHQIQFKVKFGDKDYQLVPEEIIGMMLRYIKTYAERYSKSKVTDCIITIPCFYGYKQRQSMINAVELSGMRLLRLIHDNTAAAVKHFNDNRYGKTKQYYMFYNMGGSYTQVSLISVHSKMQGTKNDMTEIQQIKVEDEAYDKNLGGRNFDYILAKLIYKKFKKEVYNIELSQEELDNTPKDIIQRILRTAIKYKEILSANKEINIKVLGIEKGNQFESILTREEFINASQDEMKKVYKPIETILNRNNITFNNIEQIEFIGGGHRIPAIKECISKNVPQDKIGIHLNGDDVIALGAGIIASNVVGLSNKVGTVKKKIELENNGFGFKIKVKIESRALKEKEKYCDENLEEIAKDCIRKIDKSGIVFKRFYDLLQERSVSFTHDSDLDVTLLQQFEDEDNEEAFIKFHIKHLSNDILPSILKDAKTIKNSHKGISMRLFFKTDKLGQITLKGELKYEIETYLTLEKLKSKNNKIQFKYIPKIPNELTEEEINDYIKEIESSKDYTNDEKKNFTVLLKSGDVNKKSKTEKRTKAFAVKEAEIQQVYPYPFDKDQIKNSNKKLQEFDELEKKNLDFVQKKNELESLIFDKKRWISDVEVNKKYAKKNELEEFEKIVNKIEQWHINESENAKMDAFVSKVKEIKNAFEVFNKRITAEKKRNTSIKYFRSEIQSALRQGRNWCEEKPWIKEYFDTNFKALTNNLTEWINEMEKKQSELTEYEDAIIRKSELDEKLENLHVEAKKMKNIPRKIQTKDDL